MRIGRFVRKLRPIKGTWYYECQIGPLVYMWQHDMSHKPQSMWGGNFTLRWGRLYVWHDTCWNW